MSALSITTPTTRLRITTRGRRVLAAIVALPVAVVLAYVVVSSGTALASRDAGAPSATYSTVTVSAGDTLWSLAEEIAPAADPRDVVSAIARLNSLPAGTIEIGQRLAIPAEYAQAL